MKTYSSCLISLFVLLFSLGAMAEENFPIVSANGFSCSQQEGMVSCRGAFPENPNPVLEVTGYNVVWVRADYPGYRYSFFSDSGCLCRTGFKPGGEISAQDCTSRFGQKKTFKAGKDTYEWCKKN